MSKRKAISKSLRFEIFKRDGFVCQYCGAAPPAAVLHVDHIVAVAAGGGNGQDNLITSCSTCNLGKSARDLKVAPQPLSEKAAEIAEKEEQLRGYQSIVQARSDRLDEEAWSVIDILFPWQDTVQKQKFRSVRVFVERLGVHEAIDAAEIAMSARVPGSAKFRYFCGICWKKIKGSEADA